MREDSIRLGLLSLGKLMPMHLCVDGEGRITSVGPTLARLFAGRPMHGASFFDLFLVKRPGRVDSMQAMRGRIGNRLKLEMRHLETQGLRGIAVPLPEGEGIFINLSFGIEVISAVAEHQLTLRDFAPTDLAMELLYLFEAKTLVTEELRSLNTRLYRARDVAEEMALTDPLTGLRNRRGFDLALAGHVAQHQGFALMHLDLDYFKSVNDRLGHAAGDHVLRIVGQTLLGESRTLDTVARVGGDEFMLILDGLTQRAVLSRIATRIIHKLEEPIDFAGHVCNISGSIGMSISTDHDHPNASMMLAEADEALYSAKDAGRGRAHFAKIGSGQSLP